MIQNAKTELEQMWQAYHERRTKDNRNVLVEHYLPVTREISLSVVMALPRYIDRDSVIQEGHIGLMDAVEKYKPKKGKFTTYLTYRVRGAVFDYLREAQPGKRGLGTVKKKHRDKLAACEGPEAKQVIEDDLWASDRPFAEKAICSTLFVPISIDSPYVFGQTEVPLLLRNILPAVEADDDPVESDEWWINLCRGFSFPYKLAIILRYKHGMNQKAIGKTVGLSESRMSQILSLVPEILRGVPQIHALAVANRITDREKNKERKPGRYQQVRENKFQKAVAMFS